MIPVETILPWVLPPLLGACIGYLTNSVAIRMLFRPLRERRVFGVRVPFTPGVIPRRRHELAESIGNMVARELLTSEVFTNRFTAPRFAFTLRRTIGRMLDDLSRSEAGSLHRRAPIGRALELARDALRSFLCDDPAMIDRIRALASRVVTEPPEAAGESRAGFLDAILEIPIGVFEPVWGSTVFEELVAGILSRLEQPLAEYFERREVIVETDARIRRLLHYSFDQLSTVQRFVVSAGQFDRQMESRIPQLRRRLVSELRSLITEPRIAIALVGGIRESLDARRERPLATFLGDRRIGGFFSAEAGPIVAAIANRLVTSERCTEIVDRLYAAFLGLSSEKRAVGELFPVLARRRGAIAYAGTRSIQELLVGRADALVASLDIRRVVVDKVDSLDVERVEALLLGIIKRHLRWINLFGALIGALIGGVQIGLSLLGFG